MRPARQGCMVVVLAGLALGWGATGAAEGASQGQLCEARKLRASGHKAQCLLKEEAKEVLGATSKPDKCSGPFETAFESAEAIAGPGVCPTEGDVAAIESQVDACTDRLAAALSGVTPAATHLFPATGQTISYKAGDDGDIEAGATLSYTDNGDGTITDNNTGLMWAKKDDNNVDSLHDKDTTYTWANAFDVHIAGLNAGAGFAGYTDWRLPNVKELQSIVNWERSVPAVSSAFNTGCVPSCTVLNCSCTKEGFGTPHWSSTSSAANPLVGAWFVNFESGYTDQFFKFDPRFVRAVRGGL